MEEEEAEMEEEEAEMEDAEVTGEEVTGEELTAEEGDRRTVATARSTSRRYLRCGSSMRRGGRRLRNCRRASTRNVPSSAVGNAPARAAAA